jgi:hypothetical protein
LIQFARHGECLLVAVRTQVACHLVVGELTRSPSCQIKIVTGAYEPAWDRDRVMRLMVIGLPAMIRTNRYGVTSGILRSAVSSPDQPRWESQSC